MSSSNYTLKRKVIQLNAHYYAETLLCESMQPKKHKKVPVTPSQFYRKNIDKLRGSDRHRPLKFLIRSRILIVDSSVRAS